MKKILLVLAIFFLTRLLNLTALPVFTDEASYWNAANEVADNFSQNWDLSIVLPVAKPPLFIWLSSLVIKLGIDGIVALRFVSVFSGLLLLTAIYLLAKELFGEREAQVASFLYIILPFGLFYDRLGIMETLLVFFLTLAYFLFLNGLRKKSLTKIVLSGVSLGVAILTKQSGQIGLLVIVFLALSFFINYDLKLKNLIRVGTQTAVTFLVGLGLSDLLKLSSKYPEYANFAPTQITNWTFDNLAQATKTSLFNISAVGTWLKSWFTFPLFYLIIASFLILPFTIKKRSLPIFVIFALPVLFQAILSIDLFPRYFLMVVPAMLMSLSFLILKLWDIAREGKLFLKFVIFLVFSLSFLPSSIFSYQIIFDVASAPLHYNERWQYLSGWPSGYGVSQAATFLKNYPLAEGSKILLDGHNGHLKDSLFMFGIDTKSMRYLERDLFEKEDKKRFDLIVANRSPDYEILGFKKLAVFEKPDKDAAIIIFAPSKTSQE